MSKADDCQSPNPSQFHFNEVAAALATAFSLLTLLFYIWNIGCLISSTPQTHNSPRPHKRERHEIAINPLSGLIAAVLGIVLIFATWPQPLEGASLLVVLLAQASVLGWQDHDPDSICKDLVEKVPDVLAVIVAAYALGDARKKYQDATGNTFMEKHDPRTEMILAYVLTAAGAVLGFFQELKITQDGISRDDQQRVLSIYSMLFFIVQLVIGVITIVFGGFTLPDGCAVFNTPKVTSMVALGIGCLYSLVIVSVRSRFKPVRD